MYLLFSLSIRLLSFAVGGLPRGPAAPAAGRKHCEVTIRSRRGRGAAPRFLRAFCALILINAPLASAQAVEDTYLELLDQEVTKVEPSATDTSGDVPGGSRQGEGTPAAAPPASSRAHFEAQMRRQQVGTYSFYSRLPERSREEIFLDYSSGASMDALREKIIDRYLHP